MHFRKDWIFSKEYAVWRNTQKVHPEPMINSILINPEIEMLKQNLTRYIIVRDFLSIEHEKLRILYRRVSMKGAENGNI